LPIVAAGVTSASPALANLLSVVAHLPRGAVILPDLDLSLSDAVWDMLGSAGNGDPPFGEYDAPAHPQYHLKLLLNRMNLSRKEVQAWHRAGMSAAPPERSRAISNLFLPAQASGGWFDLPAAQRRLSGVRLMECAHPGEEAQAIAILMRETLETPERRVALITPDRALAGRVVAHLRRWGITADDTAGQPLSQTTAGRLVLLLAEVAAQQAAPVPLLALLEHPWVRSGEARAGWLDHARALDLALRGPRPAPGLPPLRVAVVRLAKRLPSIQVWWEELETLLGPLLEAEGRQPRFSLLDQLARVGEALCGNTLWGNADGRALAALVEELREAAGEAQLMLDRADLPAVLRDAMDRVAVRPPWGGHPRVAIYGLLEARMSRADLVICGGLTEGSWPASQAPDPLLPPAVLRALGVPGAEFRTGLAAHDLAGALGAPEVVLSWSQRDEGGPVIPSRFVLRVQALLGELAPAHAEQHAVELARTIDLGPKVAPHLRPAPEPTLAQRDVSLRVTAIDRLLGDPYQFYAQAILRLPKLDTLDAEPSAAWKGTVIHKVLERWHKAGGRSGELLALASEELAAMQAHPLVRTLWWPRLARALEWIDGEVARLQAEEGRSVLESEIRGEMTFAGVKVHGRADRIDRLPDGSLAIVDYKTGKPPSRAMVADGNSLQLGVLGLIAREHGFAGVAGDPEQFEYWSFGRDRKRGEEGFGYRFKPFRTEKAAGISEEEFLESTEDYLARAIAAYIKGEAPFEASLQPDLLGYNDYDQLMRLDEWQARGSDKP
ncbi:MAG TPA: double-strand break repair protein AddB, partial [Novosphingobium sp.]|nr:double-strand break repair protein AddB [Novosphingobium sp.]